MTDFVEIPDDNSSDGEVGEELQMRNPNPAFDELKSLKSEMEFRGSLLGKTWSELSHIMSKYQARLIEKHDQVDSSLTGADHFRISHMEQELKRCKTGKDKLQKQVTDMETKILDKDTEIVKLRTEVHKYKNEVGMKDNLIQKIQGQMAQEALEYQTEITSLRDMLEGHGQGDYSMDVTPVPVSSPQPVKRRKIIPKPQTPRQSIGSLTSPRKQPQTFPIQRIPSSLASPAKMEPQSPMSSPVKTESFQSQCLMPGTSQQQNEMDPSFPVTDQGYNELHNSDQEQFFQMDQTYDESNSVGMDGLMQGQDPNMLLENAPMTGQDQISEEALVNASAPDGGSTCDLCNKWYSTRGSMLRHRTGHARPYQCVICQKRFTQRPPAVKHVRQIHHRSDADRLVDTLFK